jgi:glutamine synthetase
MLNAATGRVYGWPDQGYPAPQGPFYCGVGAQSVFGRPLAEAHMDACMKVGACSWGVGAVLPEAAGLL